MPKKKSFEILSKKTEFAGIALFGYGVFWLVLSGITLAFAGGILNNESLIQLSQIGSFFAIIISVFYIIAAILVWDQKLYGGLLTFILVAITFTANVVIIILGLGGLGLITLVQVNFAVLPSALIIVGVLGLAINILIGMLIGSSWQSLNGA